MERETKSISKSVRMTPAVFDMVDKFEGNGFNEKFENLVLFCLKEESNIRTAIKEKKALYDRQVAMRVKEIESLDKQINSKREVLESLKQVTVKANDLIRTIDKITTDYK